MTEDTRKPDANHLNGLATDKPIVLLNERPQAKDLVCQTTAAQAGCLRMHESYEGEVRYVGENTVVVVYNVEGRLVEQTYEKKQFKDGVVPAVGACLKVIVSVVEFDPEPPGDSNAESTASDKPSHRKPLTGPVEF